MLVYAMILGLSLVLACIGAILGKQAASVFVTDMKIQRVSAVVTGVSGVIVAITLVYISGLLK